MQQHKFSTNRIALTGILLSLALIMSFIEAALPPVMPAVPYAKIGFSNIVLLTVLLLLGYRTCITVLIIKCVFVGIFTGNPFSIVYSLPAGLISYSITALLMNLNKLSITAISTIGSLVHNLVQVIIASFIVGKTIWYILPYLFLLGGLSGIGIGIITFILLKFLPVSLLIKYAEGEKLRKKEI